MATPVAYLSLATHFLRLAESSSDLLVRRRNALSVVSGKEISPDEYFRKTRWSDHAVGIAILFNFYHGVELTLKGSILHSGQKPSTTHSLSALHAQLKKLVPSSALVACLSDVIHKVDPTSPLGQFFSDNNVSIDDWYEALKYPESIKGKNFSHVKLKYRSESALKFWRSLSRNAKAVRLRALSFERGEAGA